MKKVIFLTAAASLSMAYQPTPEELRKYFREHAVALRADDASDDTLYWVQNDNGRRWADDEQDDQLWGNGDHSLGLIRDDEVQDNNLIINKIKDGYYTATNWALSNPDKVHGIVNFGANMLMNPKWDDELMQKTTLSEKLKKTHDKKKVVVPEAQDNNLIINKIKDGYYTATNWALSNPEKVHGIVNFGANMLMNPRFDDELMAKKKHHKPTPTQQADQAEQSVQPAPIHLKKKKGGKFRPIAQPQPVQSQPEIQVADNALFELGSLLNDAEN